MSRTEKDHPSQNIIGNIRLVRNVIFNIIGELLPLLVAVITIPVLIRELGTERFGILSIVWLFVGYFTLFDLGLGRALIKLVSERLGKNQLNEISSLIWTGLVVMAIFGIIGALIFWKGAPWIVTNAMKIPSELRLDTLKSFYVLSAAIPIVIMNISFRGILSAYQKFGLINAVRIPIGIFTFICPIIVIQFSHNIFPIVLGLIFGRIISGFIYLFLSVKTVPGLKKIEFKQKHVKPLLSFGGWMTVSNIVSPLMMYMDHILIGALISMSAVAYYTTPYSVVSKLSLIAMSVVTVLFPAFSYSIAKDQYRTNQLYKDGLESMLVILFPLVLIIVTFADLGLDIWIGKEFVENSTFVMQILAVGVFFHAISLIPFSLIQGGGRADWTAKFHLIQLVSYLPLLILITGKFGINGVAVLRTSRIVISLIVLFLLANKLQSSQQRSFSNKYLGVLFFWMFIILIGSHIKDLLFKVTYVIIFCCIYTIVYRRRILQFIRKSTELLHKKTLKNRVI